MRRWLILREAGRCRRDADYYARQDSAYLNMADDLIRKAQQLERGVKK